MFQDSISFPSLSVTMTKENLQLKHVDLWTWDHCAVPKCQWQTVHLLTVQNIQ